jgi:serine/threonine protein kinase
MSCLSSALVYMHAAGVTHGDLKPNNILIRGRHVWLADFGTAEFEVDSSTNLNSTSRWATPVYCPPEVHGGSARPRGRAADLWSFGCVLLEVSTWLAGYSVQALRDFRGEERRQPYHVDFEPTMEWVETLYQRLEIGCEHLRARESILDAVLDTVVLEPDGRLTGLEVWEQLTSGTTSREGGCPCDMEPVPTVDKVRQLALEACPSGVLPTPEETESAVISAMEECRG